MKYMGNKTKMLPVLGEVISFYGRDSETLADPFCGSAAVSWFMAMNSDRSVIAGDIQSFAVDRARAVVERIEPFEGQVLLDDWFARARIVVDAIAAHFPNHLRSIRPDMSGIAPIQLVVAQSRRFCKEVLPVVFKDYIGAWPVSKAYGGYYFSPEQSLILDALRQTLPDEKVARSIGLASLTDAASKAAAAPGHTAQPFQPTSSSAKYIIESWTRDVWGLVRDAVFDISAHSANRLGEAVVGDFRETLGRLSSGDLVFADPPYLGSSLQSLLSCARDHFSRQ